MTSDYYGLKNFGTNYGVLYTAWGFSGAIGPVIAGAVVDATGSKKNAYLYAKAAGSYCVCFNRDSGGGALNLRKSLFLPTALPALIKFWMWILPGCSDPAKGIYFYLYLILDLFSRKIIAWDIWLENPLKLKGQAISSTGSDLSIGLRAKVKAMVVAKRPAEIM